MVCGKGEAGKARLDQRRRFDGLLNVHSEVDDVEKRLHRSHHLIVCARAAGNHERCPSFITSVLCKVFRGLLRGSSALASRGSASSSRRGNEDDAGVTHDHSGPEFAVQAGHETHHVAILVDHRDVAGVAAMASRHRRG